MVADGVVLSMESDIVNDTATLYGLDMSNERDSLIMRDVAVLSSIMINLFSSTFDEAVSASEVYVRATKILDKSGGDKLDPEA